MKKLPKNQKKFKMYRVPQQRHHPQSETPVHAGLQEEESTQEYRVYTDGHDVECKENVSIKSR